MLQCLDQTDTTPISLPSIGRQAPPLKPERVTKPSVSLNPRLIIEHAVTLVFGVASGNFHDPRRGKAQVALARQTAMYLAHVGFSLTLTEVGVLFDRDRTTVAHACALIEDRRDNRDFDRALELLERAVKAMQHLSFSQRPTVVQSVVQTVVGSQGPTNA